MKGLHNAHLSNANFEGAKGLLEKDFAQNDITGCTLPKEIGDFKMLKSIEEISRNARTIFIAMITACVYSWLAIATAPDAGLISNAVLIKLPIINTEISVFGFYMVSPLILLSIFVYLHLYLQRLWDGFRHMPAVFPDGKRLDQRAYPWLMNGLVRRHFEKLKNGRNIIAYIEEIVTIFLSWCMVPFTLLVFWFAYMRSQDVIGLTFQGILLVLSIIWSLGFYRKAKTTLRTIEDEPFVFKEFLKSNELNNIYIKEIHLIFATLLIIVVSKYNVEINNFIENNLGYHRRFLNLSEANLQKVNLFGIELKKANLQWANLDGANLQECNLQEANLQEASLRGANLQSAKMLWAYMRGANLQGADLSRADMYRVNLQEANLQGAKFQWAKMKMVNLQKASLQHASLQWTYLAEANLQMANLQGANLEGANLEGANLEGANLEGANLEGANLSLVKGLTNKMLLMACGDESTILTEGYLVRFCDNHQKAE